MGGVDKGLQLLQGVPLAMHAIRRLALQVGRITLNANRNLEIYQSFGAGLNPSHHYRVLPDAHTDYAGPLSGFAVGLAACQTPYLLTVPCDSPCFPIDLASRMALGLQQGDADIAMAAQGGKTQPVFCLMRCELLPSLEAFMASGKRKIDAWTAQHRTAVIHFDNANDDPMAFANINTLEELSALERCAP